MIPQRSHSSIRLALAEPPHRLSGGAPLENDGHGAVGARARRNVSDFEERTVGDLRIRIDRTLCVGFADCITEAPEAFVLDESGTAVFVKPEDVERERLLKACDVCPVDAITVWDADGAQIVPPSL